LNKIFTDYPGLSINEDIDERSMLIPPDSLLNSKKYKDYIQYKSQKALIENNIKSGSKSINEPLLKNFISTNPEYYLAYKVAGDYCREAGFPELAKKYYNLSLTKELPSISEKKSILKLISK
jgi:hypothetical protein